MQSLQRSGKWRATCAQLCVCMHAAEELAELRQAVLGVREALADLRANVEPSRTSVLKLNVRDARDSLRRRVNQLSPETSSIQVGYSF